MQVLPRRASRWSAKTALLTPSSSPSAAAASPRAPFICNACQKQPQRGFASLRETAGHARLSTRRLISISGVDAPHFLQGLTTTSIEGNKTGKPWFYCGFLNALGRVLHDVFIYPVPADSGGDPHFMIEVDAAQHKTLLAHLKRYKLRSKIFLRAIEEDEMSVWQVWDDAAATTHVSGDARITERSVIVPDMRAPGMGYRVLTTGAELSPETLDLSTAEKVDETSYRLRRYLRGVPEGSAEIIPAQALPLESNMDIMGGIDFRKGCYVGQELTIRTRHRGVVRKRILPCVLYGENEARPTGLEYVPGEDRKDLHGLTIGRYGKTGRSTGTFLAGVGNVGLALCRVQLMTDLVVPNDTATLEFDPTAEFVIQPSKDAEGEAAAENGVKEVVKVKAFVPEWLHQRVGEDGAHHAQ